MLFNSYIFWVFLALVLILHRALPHRGQNRVLLVASYVFYGYWDWRFLALIWASTIIDFVVAQRISGAELPKVRKRWLKVSLIANLGFLGFFKYFNFFADSFASMLRSFGVEASNVDLNIVLPVGISFYTFQTLSYTIDVYRGHTKVVRNLEDFALYVAFFPQLVAGPIERSSQLLPQIQNPRKRVGESDFAEGLCLIISGLFKKVVIADSMATYANAIFATPADQLTGPEAIIGVYAFAFQIYGDFSGYSDIARGVSRWLGFNLMVNFRMPYFAPNITEFWRRWHISLSGWLRDYLYIPLGGNRKGKLMTYRNLMLTMLLGGLWHGASWTFVVWGALHGFYLAVHKMMGGSRLRAMGPVRKLFGIVFTVHLVCLAWIFFRAESFDQAWSFLVAIATNWETSQFAIFGMAFVTFYVLPLLVYELWLSRAGDMLALVQVHWGYRAAVYSFAALMILFFHAPIPAEFIYFQF